MICVHCGKEIDNGQAFCPYCGSRVGGDAAPEAKAAKKDPRKLALPVAAVALLAVVGVGLANRMPSIDLQRYVTITAQGYDTLGKLDVSFDTDKLEADYGKRIADSFKKAMNDHKESTYGLSSLAADLYSGSETELFVDYCATGSADKTSGLRNGDVITYSWNESEDEAETLFGVKVKYSDITYTVSGLEKVNTFDAFDGVTVEFNGTAPQGTATVNSLPTAEAGGIQAVGGVFARRVVPLGVKRHDLIKVVARLHLPHTGGFLHSGGFALGGICGGGFLGGFRRFDSRSRCFLRHRRCSRAAPGQHCRSHQTGQGHNFLFHHDFLLCFCFAYTHSIASPHQKFKASPKNHREILCHDDIISPLSFLFNTLYRTSCFPAPAKTYTAVRPQ